MVDKLLLYVAIVVPKIKLLKDHRHSQDGKSITHVYIFINFIVAN